MKIKDITQYLESIAPSMYQESYDNSGLIVGDANAELTGAIICLDSTEEVIDEAIAKGCNLVIAHHPIVFKGLKRFNGRNYVEKTVMKAIKHDVAIYAIHTNLDNVRVGVNEMIARKLGLQNLAILAPKNQLQTLQLTLPTEQISAIKTALQPICETGISFTNLGSLHNGSTSDYASRLETTFPIAKRFAIEQAIANTLTKGTYPISYQTSHQKDKQVGAGMIGELAQPVRPMEFLKFLKDKMKAGVVRYTDITSTEIRKVAVCGGSGGFLLNTAIAKGADIFITADYKYHEFFDANNRIIIADIGHYESEQYTIDLIFEILSNNFTNFAFLKTSINTNPVNYL